MLPEYPREVMPVYTQDSAHLECPVFTYVCSTSHDIPATIVLRIAYIGNLTVKDMPATCAVLNLYRLLRHDDSVYYFLNTHILIWCGLVYRRWEGNRHIPKRIYPYWLIVLTI